MRSQFEIEQMIERRLRSYLSRDKTGIRREVLRLLLRIKQVTVADILAELKEQFSVSFHTIASMVGIIASRIGILRISRNAEGISTYELKEKYAAMVVRLVSA
jgi:DNA-binding transcriptional ArsR family regulator